MIEWDEESCYRAKIILLKDEGYTVPEIRREPPTITISTLESGYIDSMKKVLMALYPENTHMHKPTKISDNIKRKKDSCEIAAVRNPRDCYHLSFSTWSLRVLAGYISKELNLVDSISHTEIRNILLKHGIRYRQSKVTLGDSMDPEYHLKKRELKKN